MIAQRIRSMPLDLYTGQQNDIEREQVLKTFKSADAPRGLLISLRAGGVGLNLQEASTVVLFDRWWNPAVEDQAVERAHRFGRTKVLYLNRFLVTDSIEERIDQIRNNPKGKPQAAAIGNGDEKQKRTRAGRGLKKQFSTQFVNKLDKERNTIELLS